MLRDLLIFAAGMALQSAIILIIGVIGSRLGRG
jgi:hypothetical protein